MSATRRLVTIAVALGLGAFVSAAYGQEMGGGTKADAERAIQAYLAMWGSGGRFDAQSVARFYAPQVVYYGKHFSRAQVLADKRRYARAWPVRHYAEVPGSFSGHCNAARTLCKVGVTMRWRRVGDAGKVSTGRARLGFDFVPVEGGRKIARESATILPGRG